MFLRLTLGYVYLVAHLVRKPGDVEGAIARASEWVILHACTDVQTWLQMALKGSYFGSVTLHNRN